MNAELARQVQEDGADAGRAAASWVEIDSDEHAARLLHMIEDVDPEWADSIPSPLSGEWADDPAPRDILERFDMSEDDEGADGVLESWEAAYVEAYGGSVESRCRDWLRDSAHFDRFDIAEAYSVYVHDYNDPRSDYIARKASQLRRCDFHPRPNLSYSTLTPNALGIYLGIVDRQEVNA